MFFLIEFASFLNLLFELKFSSADQQTNRANVSVVVYMSRITSATHR